tara:strand:+ start:175 stop:729 length:555 start_codon:yes stop_codon:yes gene_type:complete
MNQRLKYYMLISLVITLLIIYVYDGFQIREKKHALEQTISKINLQLETGGRVITDIKDIREEYNNNKKRLIDNKITGVELMEEIGRINDLAKQMDINLSNLEIDPDDTFPKFIQNSKNNNPQIERQSLSFILNGNFLNIGNFIDELEGSSSPLRIQNCSIKLDSLDPLGVIAKLEYLTYGGEGS